MSADTSWGNNGNVGQSGSCRTYYPYGIKVHNGIIYVTSYYDRRIRKIRVSDGACLGSIVPGNWWAYPRSLDIHNGHLFVGTNRGLFTQNLSNGANKMCPSTNRNEWRYSYTITGSGNYLYSHYAIECTEQRCLRLVVIFVHQLQLCEIITTGVWAMSRYDGPPY